MIFATTGTQLAFPRFMRALNDLAPELDELINAQVGPESGAVRTYPNLKISYRLAPAEYAHLVAEARVIVAHAGVGSILTARENRKPLILVPRRHDLGEHRNDHQLATAAQVAPLAGIYIAWDIEELGNLLQRKDLEPASESEGSEHRLALTAFVHSWVFGTV